MLVSKIKHYCLKYDTTVHKQIVVSKIRHKHLKWGTSVQNEKTISKIKPRFPKLGISDQKLNPSVQNHAQEHQLKNVKNRKKLDDYQHTTESKLV